MKILIRDVIVETIRTLLSSGLLTFWWSNEHPAGKGFGQPKRQKIADANLFLVGPWPGALLLVPPVLPLAAPPSTPTFLISTYKWLYKILELLIQLNDIAPAFHQPNGDQS